MSASISGLGRQVFWRSYSDYSDPPPLFAKPARLSDEPEKPKPKDKSAEEANDESQLEAAPPTSEEPQPPPQAAPNPEWRSEGLSQSSMEKAGESMGDVPILRTLAGYLFPSDNPEYRWRVGGALTLLVSSKLLNVTVPFMFKYAVDALTADPTGTVKPR
ncbi:hypothetical protein WJX72_005869 [[Myrmecia] bisecta]|uniref:Uncharacterized protein n=1 Tax=[Myrmecia] bisecta TaxID=41462 RepID=A0AAW1PGS2_9CHLO